MKSVSKVLFLVGIVVIGLGVCMLGADLMLAVRLMTGGLVVLFFGEITGEFAEDAVEVEYYI